ncbi:LOW QUALITY PROTEIN: uncharacterized protein ACOB6Z_010676 [Ctenodactylus gundi]
MGEGNQTYVIEFILLGLSQNPQVQILLFCVFLVIYLLSVFGNLLIIILIQIDSHLHTPMYFFLTNLSFADLCFSTSIIPQMLVHFLVKSKTISFAGCSMQIIVFLLAGCTECTLLAVMAYDRYVAVCKPLHYSTIMTQSVCSQLAVMSWISGALVCSVDSAFTLCLPYQGQNVINHYFCEPPALLKLASSDTYNAEMALFSMGVVILLAPVSLILVSYYNIISTVIRMQSGEGRLKVFSTCGSHLTVVVLYYGSGIFAYMRPNSKTMTEKDKVISVFYSVMTSMLNPMIYSLRNKDVKEAFRKVRCQDPGGGHHGPADPWSHEDHVVKRMTDGHIPVIGHERQEEVLCTTQCQRQEHLKCAASEGDGVISAEKVHDSLGGHHRRSSPPRPSKGNEQGAAHQPIWKTAGRVWRSQISNSYRELRSLLVLSTLSHRAHFSRCRTRGPSCSYRSEGSQTYVIEFILLGLSQSPQVQILLFSVFLVIYLLSVFGNLLIIILIQTQIDSHLHTPMYFFLTNLSFADLCFSTSIAPMLVQFLVNSKTISFAGCSVQIIVFLLAGCTECTLLAVMAYDRYVAVCKPLHYSTIMTQSVCSQLAVMSWISGALVCSVDSAFTLCLPYQGQNVINHYFREPPALLKLASSDTYNAEMALFSMGVVILLAPVSLILVSYYNIISTVIRMQSGEGRLKVFPTCGSHLTVVVLYYGSGIFAYMRPNSKTMTEKDKVISVFYSVMTSMLNPMIYSLKNKDVKEAFRKVAGR